MRREPSKRTSVRDARSARPNARERGPRRPLLCAAIYMLRHAVCGHRERGKDGTQVADLSRDASQAGLWSAILGALTKTTPGIEEIVGDQGARRALERTLRRLDGSRDLGLELAAERAFPPICVRAAEHRLTPRDSVQLELLRKGLDGITPSRGWEAEAP